MLVELDGSAIDDALADAAMSRECIENFLLAHHAGKHLFWLDRDQIGALGPIAETFSSRARGALRDIRSRVTLIRGLRDRVRWVLRLGLGPAFDGAAVTEAGKEIIRAHLHHFHDQERTIRSVMLGENLRDADLYVTVGKAFVAANEWRVRLAFEERLGGGDTTAEVFQRLVADGRIALAIVDGDRTHPGGPIGATADKLSSIATSAFHHVHVLRVRAAENVVASAVYHEAFANPPPKPNGRNWAVSPDALPRLMHAETLPSTHAWRDHADLKRGLKLTEVQAMNAGPERTFWAAVATDLGRDQCQQPQACAALPPCGCYVTDALDRDALALAVAWLKLHDSPRDRQRNARLLGLAPGSPLRELCERVLAWGLALNARRS